MPNNLLCQSKVHLKDLYCIAQSLLSYFIDCFTLSFVCLLKINKYNSILATEQNKISFALPEQDMIKMKIFNYSCSQGFSVCLLVSSRIVLSFTAIHISQVQIAHSLQTDQVRNRGQCSTSWRTQRIYYSDQIILLNLSTSYKTWICHSK